MRSNAATSHQMDSQAMDQGGRTQQAIDVSVLGEFEAERQAEGFGRRASRQRKAPVSPFLVASRGTDEAQGT